MKTSSSRRSGKLPNIHPGNVLAEEFLSPMGISAYRLAKDIGIPQTRVSQIIKGARRMTADTALRLSKYFGNSAKFWLGLQDDFDLEEELKSKQKELAGIPAAQGLAA
jgi:addiction module HigA family antidote